MSDKDVRQERPCKIQRQPMLWFYSGHGGLGSVEALLRKDAFLVRCIHASKAVALGCCSIDC